MPARRVCPGGLAALRVRAAMTAKGTLQCRRMPCSVPPGRPACGACRLRPASLNPSCRLERSGALLLQKCAPALQHEPPLPPPPASPLAHPPTRRHPDQTLPPSLGERCQRQGCQPRRQAGCQDQCCVKAHGAPQRHTWLQTRLAHAGNFPAKALSAAPKRARFGPVVVGPCTAARRLPFPVHTQTP